MIKNKFPKLFRFFACCFNQDWMEDFNTSSEVIDSFASEEPKKLVDDVRRELRELIECGYDEEELLKIIYDLGCYYIPTVEYESILSWLKFIENRLAQDSSFTDT
jgi:CdiI immunity protein